MVSHCRFVSGGGGSSARTSVGVSRKKKGRPRSPMGRRIRIAIEEGIRSPGSEPGGITRKKRSRRVRDSGKWPGLRCG